MLGAISELRRMYTGVYDLFLFTKSSLYAVYNNNTEKQQHHHDESPSTTRAKTNFIIIAFFVNNETKEKIKKN